MYTGGNWDMATRGRDKYHKMTERVLDELSECSSGTLRRVASWLHDHTKGPRTLYDREP